MLNSAIRKCFAKGCASLRGQLRALDEQIFQLAHARQMSKRTIADTGATDVEQCEIADPDKVTDGVVCYCGATQRQCGEFGKGLESRKILLRNTRAAEIEFFDLLEVQQRIKQSTIIDGRAGGIHGPNLALGVPRDVFRDRSEIRHGALLRSVGIAGRSITVYATTARQQDSKDHQSNAACCGVVSEGRSW